MIIKLIKIELSLIGVLRLLVSNEGVIYVGIWFQDFHIVVFVTHIMNMQKKE